MNFYNEFDPQAAAWLRELVRAGHIPAGDVDERDIRDILPSELAGYTQCHFFAGIGGWSLALALAGWPEDRKVWTGSCPCQPFSTGGRGEGFADERHLWPHWFHLIRECQPSIVFGEQVASKDGLAWLDLVSSDMEGSGYAFGANDICAAGLGSPQMRQRLWFVGLADTGNAGLEGRLSRRSDQERQDQHGHLGRGSATGGLADTRRVRPINNIGPEAIRSQTGESSSKAQQWERVRSELVSNDSLDDESKDRPRPTNGFWGDADWLYCIDEKWRPVEPGTFPLATRLPAHMGLLRGYGNAINPKVGQVFIEAVMEIIGCE